MIQTCAGVHCPRADLLVQSKQKGICAIMRTAIFGAKGQLGRDLMRVFSAEGETAGHDLPELDAADPDMVRLAVERFRPDVLINAAAYTDVERAESDPAEAFRVNETAAGVLAQTAMDAGIPVVYYSTDYVFNGEKQRPYLPTDPISPLGVYGASKAAGEVATRAANPAHYVLRTAWLYGPGGNHFVEKILRAAETRPSLRVVEDETGSPTHTLDLALATRAIIQTSAYGVYHAVNAGSCTRYAFARAILERAGIAIPVAPCKAADYPSQARRPAYSVLDTTTLSQAARYTFRSWEDALDDYMARRRNTA